MSTRGKERLNTWSLSDYVKNILMLLLKLPVWAVQLLLFWIPLKRNRIVMYSMKQHGYSCNLKYLTGYLNAHRAGTFELLWVVKRREDLDALRKRGINAAMAHSWKHASWRHRAGIVVTNDEFYPLCRKRRGQRYVNTWHGGVNYKKIGYEGLEFTNPLQKLIYRMNNPKPDCFVSGSRSFTQTTAQAFHFPREVFLECGLPRNDILLRGAQPGEIAAVKRALGVGPGKKLLLYAPTFRKGGSGPAGELDYSRLVQVLHDSFGGDWVILLRQHYFVESQPRKLPEWVLDVSEFEDMQQLLLCSDCLISDYSSCMWDFLLTGRPCFVYAPDMAAYTEADRAFFLPPQRWPYPIAVSEAALWAQIRQFDAAEFAKKAARHREELGSADVGRGCEMLTQVLETYLK